MRSERISIRFNNNGEISESKTVTLCELTGQNEISVQGIDTASCVELLGDIINNYSDHSQLDVREMCASDRDGLLAALHRQYWGDKIVSTLVCHDCGNKFDLSFKLSELQTHINQDIQNWEVTENMSAISNTSEIVRVPSADQELKCGASPTKDALADLCGMLDINMDEIKAACKNLEQAAPILDLELNAQCPECGAEQEAHFDIQSFVLKRLLNEREALLTEIHYLAANYSWSLSEILTMPRSMRKTLTQMLDI